jgi:hypothetical protein
MSIEMKSEVTKERVRMSLDVAGAPAASTGLYMILDGSAGTMTVVMPGMNMATVSDLTSLGANPMVRTEMKGEPTLQVEDRGPGERMLGMSTRRYHVRSEYTMVMIMGSDSCSRTDTDDLDVWTTTEIELTPTLASAMSMLRDRVAGGGLARLATAKQEKMKGVQLAVVGTQTLRSGSGWSMVARSKAEVTSVVRADIDNSRFTVPAGYNTMDVREMMAGMDPATMAAAMSAAGPGALKSFCEPRLKLP